MAERAFAKFEKKLRQKFDKPPVVVGDTPMGPDIPESIKNQGQTVTQETSKLPQEQPNVFRNEKGNLSGVSLPDGRTFFGLSPEQVRELSGKEIARKETPQGTMEQSQFATAEKEAQAQQEKVQQVQGITGDLPTPGTPNVSVKGVIPQIGANILSKAGTGAAIGAAGVGAATGGAGIIPGAIGGAILGAGTALTEIKQEQAENVATAYATASKADGNIRKLINQANKGLISIADAQTKFNEYKQYISTSKGTVKYETIISPTKWTKSGEKELVKIEAIEDNLNNYAIQLQAALIKPNPNAQLLETND